jgi:hypothetical protein
MVSGTVSTPCGTVIITSFVTRDYIHCIGIAGSPVDLHDVVWDVEQITTGGTSTADYESLSVREAAEKRLASYLHVEPTEIDVCRLRGSSGLGPPLVYCRGSRAEIDISLSHDGRFAAYAFTRH